MTIIVEHLESGHRYILLGAGLGMYHDGVHPGMPADVEGTVAVSRPDGSIRWIDTGKLRVVSVDGRDPASLLPDGQRDSAILRCGECDARIPEGHGKCGACGHRILHRRHLTQSPGLSG